MEEYEIEYVMKETGCDRETAIQELEHNDNIVSFTINILKNKK